LLEKMVTPHSRAALSGLYSNTDIKWSYIASSRQSSKWYPTSSECPLSFHNSYEPGLSVSYYVNIPTT
jgi:hypothetical protein